MGNIPVQSSQIHFLLDNCPAKSESLICLSQHAHTCDFQKTFSFPNCILRLCPQTPTLILVVEDLLPLTIGMPSWSTQLHPNLVSLASGIDDNIDPNSLYLGNTTIFPNLISCLGDKCSPLIGWIKCSPLIGWTKCSPDWLRQMQPSDWLSL